MFKQLKTDFVGLPSRTKREIALLGAISVVLMLIVVVPYWAFGNRYECSPRYDQSGLTALFDKVSH